VIDLDALESKAMAATAYYVTGPGVANPKREAVLEIIRESLALITELRAARKALAARRFDPRAYDAIVGAGHD
jgi:hypothetical protein